MKSRSFPFRVLKTIVWIISTAAIVLFIFWEDLQGFLLGGGPERIQATPTESKPRLDADLNAETQVLRKDSTRTQESTGVDRDTDPSQSGISDHDEEEQVKAFQAHIESMRKVPGASQLIDEILSDIDSDLAEGRDVIDPQQFPVDETGVPYLEGDDPYSMIQNERLREKMRRLNQLVDEANALEDERQKRERSESH